MDFGVWMSRGVLEHKRDPSTPTQVWNLRKLPEGLRAPGQNHRLFVAVAGHWRGYFRLTGLLRNDQDTVCPNAVVFDSRSWTAVFPHPAPRRCRGQGFTLEIPRSQTPETQPPNESKLMRLLSAWEREEVPDL